jgi:hypothetical protein
MDIVLVARSIGKRTVADPLSDEGHAGLVFELANEGDWIAQAGPVDGLLLGSLTRCENETWQDAFAVGRGAIWDSGASAILPVSILLRRSAPPVDLARLAAIVDGINERRLPYRYETGPNSNTFVRMVLEGIVGAVPALPDRSLALRGWRWESSQA